MEKKKTRILFIALVLSILFISLTVVYIIEIDLPHTGISIFLIRFIIAFIGDIGYAGVLILMILESMGIPIPSEIIMPFSGFLVYQGFFDFWVVVFVGTLANLIGSLIAYYIGLKGRVFLERYGRYLMIRRHHLEYAEELFDKYGGTIVLLGRNLPVVRTYISFPAGIAGMDIKKFSLYTFVGSLPWNIFLVYFGVQLGINWRLIVGIIERFDLIIVIIVILVLIYILKYEMEEENQ